MPLTRPLLSGLLLSLPLNLMAQDQRVPEPEPTIVTVSAEAVPLSAAPASVSVMTEEQIRESGAATLADLLRYMPGITLTRQGGAGGLAFVSLRGGEPNFTLVMIDGIPANDLTGQQGGSFDFTSLPAEGISQVEIIRGPISSLFGSEAIGGVINVLLKRGSGRPDLNVSGTVGNFGTEGVAASSSGRQGAVGYSVGGSFLDVDEQVEGDTLRRTSFSGTSDFSLSSRQSLRFTGWISDTRATGFPSNGGGPELSVLKEVERHDSTEWVAGAEYDHQLSSKWLLGAKTDFFDRRLDSFTPPILDGLPPGPSSIPSSQGSSRFKRLRAAVGTGVRLGDHTSANLGFQFRRETGHSDYLLADFLPSRFVIDRNTEAVSGELAYTSGKVTGSAGLRWDHATDFDSEVSSRFGLNLRISPSFWRVKTSWGQGYKLPSFYALGEPNVGNAGLLPEKSTGFDIGIEGGGSGEKLYVSLTAFRNAFRDLIDFSPELFQLVNRSRVIARGTEFVVSAGLFPQVRINGHLAYQDLQIEDGDEPLRDRPRWRGGAGLEWRPKAATLIRLDQVWVGPRYDFAVPVPGQNVVGGYASSALSLSHRFTPLLEAFLRVENLLDARYEEFIGFRSPGLYVTGGLRVSLRR